MKPNAVPKTAPESQNPAAFYKTADNTGMGAMYGSADTWSAHLALFCVHQS